MTTIAPAAEATTVSVDRYVEAWNLLDPAERRSAVDESWADDATYRDPVLDADGRDGVDAMHAVFQTGYPDHVVRRTSDIDVHHDRGRFDWEIRTPAGDVLVAGVDHVRFDADGRLREVVGFWGPTSPLAEAPRPETEEEA